MGGPNTTVTCDGVIREGTIWFVAGEPRMYAGTTGARECRAMNDAPGFPSPISSPDLGRIRPSGKIGTHRPSPSARKMLRVAARSSLAPPHRDAADQQAERPEDPEIKILLGDQETEHPPG